MGGSCWKYHQILPQILQMVHPISQKLVLVTIERYDHQLPSVDSYDPMLIHLYFQQMGMMQPRQAGR